MKSNIVDLSEYVWGRTRARLDGLTDAEYLWEPVEGCWSIRAGADGAFHPDFGDPPAFTTIAWRMFHLIVCYGAARNNTFLGVPRHAPERFEATSPAPATARDAVETLEAAHAEWKGVLENLQEADYGVPLGPAAGFYAESARVDFVLHMVDEFVHHAAEVALLRDLWAVRGDWSVGS